MCLTYANGNLHIYPFIQNPFLISIYYIRLRSTVGLRSLTFSCCMILASGALSVLHEDSIPLPVVAGGTYSYIAAGVGEEHEICRIVAGIQRNSKSTYVTQ